MCVEKLHPAWDRWSYCYTLIDKDTALYASVTGGAKVVTGDNCILEFFLKKSQHSAAAVPNYDFSSVLEISLHLSSAFCEVVNDHHLIEQNRLQMSKPSTCNSICLS